ncbi:MULTISPECIES: ankyrin repeat domain-containing protein [unclassified Wolbachia]|uniref:ankyrin repeat domain-containing protein n=1 Tax=unclassified Wolbachia TaxID=2640676 RepID=UPI00222E3975|nr:ankyrin repeat domain-containing protein [Wolbachia endosymbiont (group A) of Tiphia femorata]
MNRNLRRALRASSTDGLIFLIILIVCVVAIYSFLFDKKDINDDIYTTLQTATENCDLETMKSLVKKSKDASSISKKALYHAAKKGCLEIVTFLLDEGVDINTSLALLGAADGGQLEVVKLLLERGANPHVRGWKGRTAKTVAIKESLYPINRNNSKKPYDEIIDLLTEAEKNYKLEK